MSVYKAISAVAKEMAEKGISKDRKNQQQGFQFRGIDQVYNALAPALVRHGLLILPRIVDRTVTERVTQKGALLFYVVVKAEFDFVGINDGSIHTVTTYGEAMDSGDKATNKAMSIAYKYAAFQTFCIPTEETAVDADSQVHHPMEMNPDEAVATFSNGANQATTESQLTELYKTAWAAVGESKPHQQQVIEIFKHRKSDFKAAA